MLLPGSHLVPGFHVLKYELERDARASQKRGDERRLLHQVGRKQPNLMYRLGCKLLSSLGHSMVSLGRWLERFESPSKRVASSGRIGKAHG